MFAAHYRTLDRSSRARYPALMPDVLEQPQAKPALPSCLKPYVFNSTTAALAARKRHDGDRIRQLEAEKAAQPPKPALLDYRLALLDEQIRLTREALNGGKLEPKDRAQLVRALCGLLDQQRIAKGEPLPGSRRPASDRAARGQQPGAWLADPMPAQVAPSVAVAPVALPAVLERPEPTGWEYQDPPGYIRDPAQPEKLPGDVTP